MEPLNNIDVIILVCIALSMLVAFIRGFVKEVLSVLGFVLFVLISFYLTPLMEPWLNKYIASSLMAKFVAFLLIMAIFYAIWIIGTDKLISRVRTSTLSFMDRLFGLIFGFLRAVLILGFFFLLVKIILPEELKEGSLKESKYFMMAEGCSDLIEKMLPEDFIKDTVKSVEDLNKAEKKNDDKKQPAKEKKETTATKTSKEDQEQMDKMFEKLVNPDVKSSKTTESKPKEKAKPKGYDKKETSSLDRLIDITAE